MSQGIPDCDLAEVTLEYNKNLHQWRATKTGQPDGAWTNVADFIPGTIPGDLKLSTEEIRGDFDQPPAGVLSRPTLNTKHVVKGTSYKPERMVSLSADAYVELSWISA